MATQIYNEIVSIIEEKCDKTDLMKERIKELTKMNQDFKQRLESENEMLILECERLEKKKEIRLAELGLLKQECDKFVSLNWKVFVRNEIDYDDEF